MVNLVATNFGLFEVTKDGLALREIAPGVTVDEVKAKTDFRVVSAAPTTATWFLRMVLNPSPDGTGEG